jgi:ribonuclease Z
MARVIFLGTASALPSTSQDNSSLLFESNGSYLMVDCSGSPYRKLLQLKVERERLEHVLITHHHVDHCYALPSLVECLWIEGRYAPLHIYALPGTIEVIAKLLDIWDLRTRNFRAFPIELHTINGYEDELVLQTSNFTVRTTPTVHAVPSVATKVIFPNNKSFVYSSDTAPCDTLVRFAKGADYALMECTFCNDDTELAELTRHISSTQFGELAHEIDAPNSLVIHHSDVDACPHEQVLYEIGQSGTYPLSKIRIPRDMESLEIE